MEYFFSQGEEVVVVAPEPDPDFLDRAFPVGTVGYYLRDGSHCEHPETHEDVSTCWVLFDGDPEVYSWCDRHGDDSGKVEACMFTYMIAPAKDDTFEPGNLEDLL